MRVTADIERSLGAELMAALRGQNISVRTAAPASGAGYPGYQASAFRIETLEGRVLKGRTLRSPQAAEQVEAVARTMPGLVPPVLCRSGRALVTEWVEGRRLEADACTAARLRQAGAFLASAHLRPISAVEQLRAPARAQWRHSSLPERAALLVADHVLEAREGDLAVATALQHAPGPAELHCTLGDFCPENIVVCDSGDIHFVDHEALAFDPGDYDLARTWYRWPMSEAQRGEFFAAYAEHRPLHSFIEHFPFWAVCALLGAAAFRLGRHVDAAAIPIACLRSLLAQVGDGVPLADIVYKS